MTSARVTIGSLFSGIGGLDLGLEWAGLGPIVWQCEVDSFCRRVLAKHWPNVTRFEDVTRPRDWPAVDLICGGFPCQDVSSAGKQRGLGGERSSLWWYYAAIVQKVRPRFVVVENVASGTRLWLPHVRHTLHLLGYRTRAFALSADDVGAPHLRRRVFVLGNTHRQGEPSPSLDGEVARMPSVASSASAWTTPPEFRGVDDGLPGRLDRTRRLKALGNAVVPQCAEVVGRIVRDMSDRRSR
jgi:DNA (cytosine-5)-methyltransferase 1